MNPGLQQVANFLKLAAVSAFNQQFGRNYDWTKFNIYSMEPNVSAKCAFEIVGQFPGEQLILHIYSEIGRDNYVGHYQLRDEVNFEPTIIEKRYVALARFNESVLYLNNNFIRRECPAFPSADSWLDCIMEENFFFAIRSEKGDYILPERAATLTDGL